MGTATSPLQRLIQRAASAYTAGPTIVSARAVCDRLASLGIASAVCYWNRPTDSPLFTTQRYLALLSLLRDLRPHSYLSVKAPALGFNVDLLRQVLDQARRTNSTVHFDAMSVQMAMPEKLGEFQLLTTLYMASPRRHCLSAKHQNRGATLRLKRHHRAILQRSSNPH